MTVEELDDVCDRTIDVDEVLQSAVKGIGSIASDGAHVFPNQSSTSS
jgi:hypothetical protein